MKEESGYIGSFDRDRKQRRSITRRRNSGDSRRFRYTRRGMDRRGSLRRRLLDATADDDDHTELLLKAPLGEDDDSTTLVGRVTTSDEEESSKTSSEEIDTEKDASPRSSTNSTPSSFPSSAPSSSYGKAEDDEKECVTALDIIQTHPNLTRVRAALDDLPETRAALGGDRSTAAAAAEPFTFFAPTDDACFGFTQWAGFNATKEGVREGLEELLGDATETDWRRDLIAYHVVPGRSLNVSDLAALKDDDRVLEDALGAEMPLIMLNDEDNAREEHGSDGATDTTKPLLIAGLGSIAAVVESVETCGGGVIHLTDTCLLPFDGDGTLNDAQVKRLREAEEVMRARYPDEEDDAEEDTRSDDDEE